MTSVRYTCKFRIFQSPNDSLPFVCHTESMCDVFGFNTVERILVHCLVGQKKENFLKLTFIFNESVQHQTSS